MLAIERRDGELLVRNPATGRERSIPADAAESLDKEPLAVVRDAVGTAAGPPVGTDDRTLAVAVELVDRGVTPARRLPRAYAACESDLVGMVTELRVAGLIDETAVGGVPAYEPTEQAVQLVGRLRETE